MPYSTPDFGLNLFQCWISYLLTISAKRPILYSTRLYQRNELNAVNGYLMFTTAISSNCSSWSLQISWIDQIIRPEQSRINLISLNDFSEIAKWKASFRWKESRISFLMVEKTKTLPSLIIRDFLLLKNNEEKSKVLLYCFRTERLFLAAASGLIGRLASRKWSDVVFAFVGSIANYKLKPRSVSTFCHKSRRDSR